MRYRHPGLVLGLVLLVAALAACSGGEASPDASGEQSAQESAQQSENSGMSAQVASYDLAATSEPQRFMAGLVTADNEGVVGGTVQMEFAYLGEGREDVAESSESEPEPGPSAEAEFLPVVNKAPEEVGDQPTVLPPAEGAGVYETEVALDRPGFWEVTVKADLAGKEPVTATGAFRVFEEHLVPQVGDEAPVTDSLTVADAEEGEVDPAAVDSRAGSDGEIPDPQLHDTTIAEAIEQQRPLVAVFSTPVYCVSQFCGPITEAVEDLADEYGDRAAFVHVEVWRDYEDADLNDAFDAWVNQGSEGREPWVFAVDADGTIAQRWDNVPDMEALEGWLEQLPAE